MNTNILLKQIKEELEKSGTEKGRQRFQRFFKEKVKSYGLKSAEVGKLSKKYWAVVSGETKDSIFKLCDELYSSDYYEEAAIASSFSFNKVSQYKPRDFKVFERWIGSYINNWAKCDVFCTSTVAVFLEMYPDYINKLKTWAKSKNIWLKRASAVSLILLAREGKFLDQVFEIADILLTDPADMVQKGYGWLLKEASRKNQKKIFDYVVKHKAIMPRTALRYAIELMPGNLKVLAMKKV
jgi:3-methyladenine DNA glycosylase AlkD